MWDWIRRILWDYISALPTLRKDKTGKIYRVALKYVPPTPLKLYKKTPQSKDLAYKSKAMFCTVLFVLVKKGWLTRDDTAIIDTLDILCDVDLEYEVIIEYVKIDEGGFFCIVTAPL